MIAVIFEVMPHPEKRQAYLDIATALRPQLDGIDGGNFPALPGPISAFPNEPDSPGVVITIVDPSDSGGSSGGAHFEEIF